MNIRAATNHDEEQLFHLARSLSTSFEVTREAFGASFREVLAFGFGDLIVAESEKAIVGYVLGFHHPTFYANGIVSWVEEIFVQESSRGQGTGKLLMEAFERRSEDRGSKLVALATRRASGFYTAIGYQESAAYFRKVPRPRSLPSALSRTHTSG